MRTALRGQRMQVKPPSRHVRAPEDAELARVEQPAVINVVSQGSHSESSGSVGPLLRAGDDKQQKRLQDLQHADLKSLFRFVLRGSVDSTPRPTYPPSLLYRSTSMRPFTCQYGTISSYSQLLYINNISMRI